MADGNPTYRVNEEVPNEMGRVASQMLDYFESLYLPESLKGCRLIVMLDTDKEGILSTAGWESDAESIGAALTHIKNLLRYHGTDMEVMDESELHALLAGGGQN